MDTWGREVTVLPLVEPRVGPGLGSEPRSRRPLRPAPVSGGAGNTGATQTGLTQDRRKPKTVAGDPLLS